MNKKLIKVSNALLLTEFKHIFRVMKLTSLFGVLCVSSAFAINVNSQSLRVNIQANQKQAKEVIKQIEEQTDYLFVYNHDKVNLNNTVTIQANNETVAEVLNQMFAGTDIIYAMQGNNILLMQKDAVVQQSGKVVTGTIVDPSGMPVIGANVMVKGTTNGTITDMDGKFSLEVGKDAILVVSYVGYANQEISIGNQKTLSITLKEDSEALDELVVVGYGTMKKSDLTGAVTTIKSEDIQSRPVPSVASSIQGKMSGVMIQETSGDLAGRYTFSVRGTGSVTGSNDPLIVVDGVPLFNNDLSTVNTKDIVSVDVLKDASATAIYGSRAANGVVLVTTKRGSSGKPTVSFSMDVGMENIAKRYEVLTTEQQRQLFVVAFKNSNRNPSVYEDLSNPVWEIDTDWQDLGTRTGSRQNYTIGIQGGGTNNQYAISASYVKRIGTMKNSDLDGFFLRTNNDITIGKKLKIASSISASYQTQNKLNNDSWGSGAYQRLISSHSYLPAFDENGDFFGVATSADPYFGENSNPLIDQLSNINQIKTTRVLGNLKLDYNIIDGLTLSVNAGTDLGFVSGYKYFPVYQYGKYSRVEGSTTKSMEESLNWIVDATLQYVKKWNKHSINALIGVSAQQNILKNTSATGTGTVDNSLDQLSNQTNFSASSSSVTSSLASSFVRFNYNFAEKYLLTSTVRRDGSSKFGPNKRFGVFPSLSAAWRISEENFLKESNVLSNLKLRVGYGLTGNQNIADFAFVTRAYATPYIWGNNMVVGNSSDNMGNPDLQWESSQQVNIGLDASFFNNRLSFVLDIYDKQSKDLLIQSPIAMIAAVSQGPFVNIGSVQNRGVEFSANSVNIQSKKFSWTTNFNISFNKNKVLDIGTNALGEPLQIPGATIPLPADFANLTQAGQPVGAFYMLQFDGVWQSNEKDLAAKYNCVPGDPKYIDRNGDFEINAQDKDYVGSPLPTFFGGITNTFNYGPFSLNVMCTFAGGNKLYHAMRNLNARGVPWNQQLAEVADYWTEDNPSNTVPRPSQGGNTTNYVTKVSTRFLENGDYFRLKNLSLSYSLPPKFINRLGMSNAVVSISGSNLFTITKYTGLDPEASSLGSLLSGGIDYTPYPSTRLYSMSLQLTF